MRKYYIDNIRILCIFLLFPFHAAMIFNSYGESWYIHGQSEIWATFFIKSVYPWWMSVLFALAGISTVYSLKNRTAQQYIKEGFFKLFIPLLSAIVMIIPVQTYLADIYFNHYSGSYFEHLSTYFTLTDWSGYDGHFTPAHTWFMIYLFIISMISLPLMVWYKNKEKKMSGSKITMVKILPMFLVILICAPILEIGGKSVGKYALGYIIVRHVHGAFIQYVSIVAASFIFSIFMYEICRRMLVTRFLFGIKKRQIRVKSRIRQYQ